WGGRLGGTLALLVRAPGAVARAVIDSRAARVAARSPTVHVLVPWSYGPCDGVADTNDTPAGSGSSTTTPVAGLGPWLVAVTVKVTSPPTGGLEPLIALPTSTSALVPALSSTVAWSFSGLGSASVCMVFCATLTSVPSVSTEASSVSVTVAALGRSPTVHVPVLLSYVPCDGASDTSVSPGGSASCISTP